MELSALDVHETPFGARHMDLPEGHVIERRTIENTTGQPLTFILEPWADELLLAPGDHVIVEIEGPARYADVYVDESGVDRGLLSLWAWDGSDARVLRADGSVALDWSGLRVPMFAAMEEKRRAEGKAHDADV